jgi:C4-dicarboxylate-specific signal transduction histidine kinase
MNDPRNPEAAFLAAMTASATHEVRNVLAIVKESAGLIQDLIHMGAKRGGVDQEKVERAVERIELQVKRGADVLTNLNRLSHTLDQDLSTVDLEQEVEQVVFLSQRFARKKGHEVSVGNGGVAEQLVVDALGLQMALFSAMECCLEELPEGSRIQVWAEGSPGGPAVSFRREEEGPGATPATLDPSSKWERVQALAKALGATAERAEVGYGIRLQFRERPGGS